MKKTVFSVIILTTSVSIIYSTPHFFDNGNGTVTDNSTGLLWQKCPGGLSGSNCSTGQREYRNWEGAISYCESLTLGGSTTWRLPNIKEILSIAEWSNRDYSAYFPGTYYGFWSSTTYLDDYNSGEKAWYIYYSDPDRITLNPKTARLKVRCVSGP